MLKPISTFILIVCVLAACGQRDLSKESFEGLKNIEVKRLEGDTLTTSFLIQIKEGVPLHYHAYHSEHVYILEGKGRFIMDGDTTLVEPGRYIFIPAESRHSVEVTSANPMKALSIQSPEFLGKDRVIVRE